MHTAISGPVFFCIYPFEFMKKTTFAISLCATMAIMAPGVHAEGNGGISQQTLQNLRDSYKATPEARALRNAMGTTSIDVLAVNQDNLANFNTDFSHQVPSHGITDQKRSGRCWLFSGLNVLRSQMMREHGLKEMEFSQNYNFFYDQLEKANLFLQLVIDTRKLPMDNKRVEWLFQHPLSDGGQFTGVADIITKYGVVPSGVMPENYSSNNTSRLSSLIGLKLKEFGLELRKDSKASAATLEKRKEQMLGTIYTMLARTLGVPPTEFTWTDPDGNTATYTPQQFYQKWLGNDLKAGYIMLMNDPTRPYHKTYRIDYDRHVYDGEDWTYVNLPIEEIKQIAIKAIKDSTAMYFSCDVGKFLDRERGVLDPDNYDYGALLGTEFGMDKADRIRTYSSASSHAMTLMAVDLDKDGKPVKWMVENSWGPKSGHNGHLIMTDRWFDEYMFRLVAPKKYVSSETLELLKGKPELLPPWDPMFAPEE